MLLQRKAADAKKAFLQLLSSCQPPISAQSTWEGTQPLIAGDPRYDIEQLDDLKRETLFEQFLAEVQTANVLRLRRGEEAFKVIIFLRGPKLQGDCLNRR